MRLDSAMIREARVTWPRLPRLCAGARRGGRRWAQSGLEAPRAVRSASPGTEQLLREYFQPCLSVFVRD